MSARLRLIDATLPFDFDPNITSPARDRAMHRRGFVAFQLQAVGQSDADPSVPKLAEDASTSAGSVGFQLASVKSPLQEERPVRGSFDRRFDSPILAGQKPQIARRRTRPSVGAYDVSNWGCWLIRETSIV